MLKPFSSYEKVLPYHLGGHENITHIDKGSLEFFINNFKIKTFLDIGCGPGGQVELAESLGLIAKGIDGDFTITRKIDCIIHDFTKGPIANFKENFDLGWSVEFVEHVENQYTTNYLKIFQRCKYFILTHAVPGKKGHHHVNCRKAKYWIEKFENHNLIYDENLTKQIKEASTMSREFMKKNGLVFVNSFLKA